jgi:hypothetical protein
MPTPSGTTAAWDLHSSTAPSVKGRPTTATYTRPSPVGLVATAHSTVPACSTMAILTSLTLLILISRVARLKRLPVLRQGDSSGPSSLVIDVSFSRIALSRARGAARLNTAQTDMTQSMNGSAAFFTTRTYVVGTWNLTAKPSRSELLKRGSSIPWVGGMVLDGVAALT